MHVLLSLHVATYAAVWLHGAVVPVVHQLNSKNERAPDAASSTWHDRRARPGNPAKHVGDVVGTGTVGDGVAGDVGDGVVRHASKDVRAIDTSVGDVQSYTTGQLTTPDEPFGSQVIVTFARRAPSDTMYENDCVAALNVMPLSHCE